MAGIDGFVAYSEAKGSTGSSDWDQYGLGLSYKTDNKIVFKAQYWDLSAESNADSTSG